MEQVDPEYDRFSSSLRQKFHVHYEQKAIKRKRIKKSLWFLALAIAGYVAVGLAISWRVS